MLQFRARLWLLLVLAVLVAEGAANNDDFNLVMRFLHPDAGKPGQPSCAKHERVLGRRIQRVFDRNGLRRNLSKYDNPVCSDMCRNVKKGYCFFVSGGICSDRRRLEQTPRVASRELNAAAMAAACDKRADRIQYEIERYGTKVVKDNDKCKSIFLDHWIVDCYDLGN